jgi:hypothetical protein
MKHTLLPLAGFIAAVFFAGHAWAANTSHVVCAKGYCRMVYDCPSAWAESNISGTYLTDSYKYDCTETISNTTEVPADVAATLPGAPQVQAAPNGYALSYTLAYLVTEPLACPQMVVNYTPGVKPPVELASPVTSKPVVQSLTADGYQVVFTCTYK